ncbi:hypothetical protein V8F06_012412 [Rhypophila decipiens]
MGSGIEQVMPVEVLSLIIGHLFVAEGEEKYRPKGQGDLRNARLVCRRWSEVATRHLFRHVALVHPDWMPDWEDDIELLAECGFRKFKQLTASPTVQHAARCADIFSAPDPDQRDYDVWDSWESGDYEPFTSAIDRIVDLPKLQEVRIRFTDGVVGDTSENDAWSVYGFEHPDTRFHVLRAVFKAIHNRLTANDGPNTKITTLTIQNLQNKALPDDILSSKPFQSTVKEITNLRLQIAHENNEPGPDHDLSLPDRRTFDTWLQNTFLPIFADQLTTLHLAQNDYWGTWPGYFDGQGLHFPNLTTLTLRAFAIGHHDQFDWVLRQKTLQTLRLDHCVIASYITFEPGQLEAWNSPTHDWTRYPHWAFGLDPIFKTFNFPGTWEIVFDKIQDQLTNLVDFRTGGYGSRHWGSLYYFFTPEDMPCLLSPQRYITTWCTDADENSGEMELGNGDPTPLPEELRRVPNTWVKRRELNRAKETRDGDWRALKALVETVVERRRQKGLC